MKKLIFQYLVIVSLFSLTTLLFFHLIPIKIFFYKGLFIYTLTLLVFSLIFIFSSSIKKWVKTESFIAALSLAFSLNFAFFIIFPVTFERSVTVYFLNQLEKAKIKNIDYPTCSGGLTYKQAEQSLIEGYIKGKAVKKRVEEQKVAKTLDFKNDCIFITSRGKRFLKFSEFVKTIYNIR